MSATTLGWLILLFPLVGSLSSGLGFSWRRHSPPDGSGSLAISFLFASRHRALISLLGQHDRRTAR